MGWVLGALEWDEMGQKLRFKHIQQVQRDISLIKFLETLNLFS